MEGGSGNPAGTERLSTTGAGNRKFYQVPIAGYTGRMTAYIAAVAPVTLSALLAFYHPRTLKDIRFTLQMRKRRAAERVKWFVPGYYKSGQERR